MRKYGTKMEHFAKISVKSHKHATKNPFSQYRNEVSPKTWMNARMVAYPNTLYMCCRPATAPRPQSWSAKTS